MALIFIPKHFDIKFEEKCHIVFSLARVEKGVKFDSTVGEWKSVPEVQTEEQAHWFQLLYSYKASTSELPFVNAMIFLENDKMTIEFTCDIQPCEVIRSSFQNITSEHLTKLISLNSPTENPMDLSSKISKHQSSCSEDCTGDNESNYCLDCKQCAKSFCNLKSLEIHMEEHEQLVVQPYTAVESSSGSSNDISVLQFPCLKYDSASVETKNMDCPFCGKSYHLRRSFLNHVRMHKASEQPLAVNTRPSNTSNDGLEQRFPCVKDDPESFGTKNLTCPYCEQLYHNSKSFMNHLSEHMASQHTLSAIEDYTSSGATTEERLVKESTVSIFECVICHRKYRTQAMISKHLATHTGSEKDEVLSYLQSKEPKKTKKKNVMCNICGKSFLLKSKLEEHMKVHDDKGLSHTDFEENATSSRPTFKEPKKKEASLIKIKCPVCKGIIIGRAYYEQHLKMHEGERKSK